MNAFYDIFSTDSFPAVAQELPLEIIRSFLRSEFFTDNSCKMYTKVPYRCIAANSSSPPVSDLAGRFLQEQQQKNRIIDFVFCKEEQIVLGVDLCYPADIYWPTKWDTLPTLPELPVLFLPENEFLETPLRENHYVKAVKTSLAERSIDYSRDATGYNIELFSIDSPINESLESLHMTSSLPVPKCHCNYQITEYGAASGLVYCYTSPEHMYTEEPPRTIQLLESFELQYKWKSGDITYPEIISTLTTLLPFTGPRRKEDYNEAELYNRGAL